MRLIRYLLLVSVGILAVAGLSPAAAGITSSRSVKGNVAEACSLSATTVTVTVKNGSVTSTAPATVSALCNHLTGGKLSVSATRLTSASNAPSPIDYKLTVTGWGSAVIYTTAASPPAASTSSASIATSATLLFTASAVTPTGASGKNYLSTVTLGMSANP